MELDQQKIDSKPLKTVVPLPWDGIGIGLFAVISGALLLAEQWGLIPTVKWFLPLVLFVFGLVTIARVLILRK